MKPFSRAALGAAAMPLALLVSVGNGEAQTNYLPGPNRAAGQAVEVIGRAVTVVKTVHYQAELTLTCETGACSGSFPAAKPLRRLNITRLNCTIGANGTTPANAGQLILYAANGGYKYSLWIPVEHSVPNSTNPGGTGHTLNQAIDVQAGPGQHIWVRFIVPGAYISYCTVTGTQDTLQ